MGKKSKKKATTKKEEGPPSLKSAQYKFTTVATDREKRGLMAMVALECPGALDYANRGVKMWHAKDYEKSIEQYRFAVETSNPVGVVPGATLSAALEAL